MMEIRVSQHAKRRYLERISGFDFTSFDRKGLGDRIAVEAACEAEGISPDDLERLICGEVECRVPATVRMRGSRCVVRGETARYVVQGAVVTTIVPLDWPSDSPNWIRRRGCITPRRSFRRAV